ncbi:MAG TPA: tetratricopeptide repeat protein, partial [Acidobacteriaceae bacterium]
MPGLKSRLVLTGPERVEKHRMLVRDSVALSTLLTIVMALTFVTYMLFHSFTGHRVKLEQRWKARGESALANGRPLEAVESLRSALAYSPDERGLQIELATALAAAGRTQEAAVYFNTLHEAQPGDGMINLQLARLAVRQGNVAGAVTAYEAALDGTWNGDGVTRRREVRLELARYLIAQHRMEEARGQLLIAAGNAADNHGLQLLVAGLLEQADANADALTLYRRAAGFRETRTAGLVGAGRTAATEGRYLVSRNMLEQAMAQPDFSSLPEAERDAVHGLLAETYAILVLFPAENLPPHVRAVRVAHAAVLAEARLAGCGVGAAASPAGGVSPAGDAVPRSALRSALGAV